MRRLLETTRSIRMTLVTLFAANLILMFPVVVVNLENAGLEIDK